MKLPSQQDLELAYQKLLHGKPHLPNLKELSTFSQWTRLDPRLAEIWVAYVGRHWETINPSELKLEIQTKRSPAAAAVLLEFVRAGSTSKALPHWCRVVTEGTLKTTNEQFFVGLRRIGSEAMLEDAQFPLPQYRKWGFLSREPLLRRPTGSSKNGREQILLELIHKMPRITTNDYWDAIGKSVSKRQAERDLTNSPRLRCNGETKGRWYSRTKKSTR